MILPEASFKARLIFDDGERIVEGKMPTCRLWIIIRNSPSAGDESIAAFFSEEAARFEISKLVGKGNYAYGLMSIDVFDTPAALESAA